MAGGEAGFHAKKHAWRSGLNGGELGRQVQPHQPPTQLPACPECGSQRIWKDGVRSTNRGEVQRYICRACGYRFSETSWNASGESEDVERVHTTALYSDRALPYNRQVCVTEAEGTKNLAEVESRTKKRAAGATETKPSEAEIKGKIVEHAFWLKKNGYKESTIKTRTYHLRILMELGANLLDPESVKETIAKLRVKEDTKAQYVATYHIFALQNGIAWNPPDYRQHQKISFIPTEVELDQLIAACGKKTSTLLQLLKETAIRIGEAWRLKWTDIDFERRIVILNDPEKNSKARIFNVSAKLTAMLNKLPKDSERVFGYVSLENKKHDYLRFRKRLSQRLQNPRILKITFHTFRHWKATMLYHETKDILYVMDFLGHRDIRNTMRYIQLEKALFNAGNDQFHVKVAKNVEEACALIEVGFEYVTGNYDDGGKIFRKRK